MDILFLKMQRNNIKLIDHKQSEMDRIFNIRILIRSLKLNKIDWKVYIIYTISIWLLTIFIIHWFVESNLKFIWIYL